MAAELPVGETYIFIVDTDQYSGNFERPMCAYMTGRTGECGVGSDEAEIFAKEMDVSVEVYEEEHPFHFVTSVADDHGCYRPASIWPTPGWINDGMGKFIKSDEEGFPAYKSVAIFMERKPTPEEVELLKDRAEAYVKWKRLHGPSYDRKPVITSKTCRQN